MFFTLNLKDCGSVAHQERDKEVVKKVRFGCMQEQIVSEAEPILIRQDLTEHRGEDGPCECLEFHAQS